MRRPVNHLPQVNSNVLNYMEFLILAFLTQGRCRAFSQVKQSIYLAIIDYILSLVFQDRFITVHLVIIRSILGLLRASIFHLRQAYHHICDLQYLVSKKKFSGEY